MTKFNNFGNQSVFQWPKKGELNIEKLLAIVTLQNNNNSNKRYTVRDIPKNSLSYTNWHSIIMQQNWPELFS